MLNRILFELRRVIPKVFPQETQEAAKFIGYGVGFANDCANSGLNTRWVSLVVLYLTILQNELFDFSPSGFLTISDKVQKIRVRV